ncbi:uncharacterized protein LOC127753030 isoform X2 [Oryza glaberrima]|uniref:Uncharacterized protein n=1 Tax=Oryza glaberrima TaxID=4538 RepID=I1QUY6_ORYGL|nr:uncharacterized protein LOC127753030 isoform X2 [Oryza glaberrima]
MEKAAAAACGWRKGLEEGEPEWEAMELEAAAPAIFPADGGGGGGRRSPAASTIFLPDLLDGSFLSDDILPDLSQMEDIFQPAHEDDIHHLLQGPQDEADLDKWLAGQSCSPAAEGSITVQTPTYPILNLIDFIPKDGCKRGPRGARKRQTFPSRGARTRRAFPLQQLCFGTTRDKRCRLRKNNDHWTIKEVTNLVQGVSKHGVGRWTELKRDFFSTSIRTSVHLKDKWRNLLKACGIDFTSTAKGNAQKTMLWPLDKRLIEQITQLAYKHPYPRQKY